MATQPAVYATREIPDVGFDLLREDVDLHVWSSEGPPSQDHIKSQLSELNAAALVCMVSDNVSASVMDASPNLEVISTYSVGYDHIDLEAARKRRIKVGHTPGVLTETTADLTWALILAAARRVVEGHEYVADGEWNHWSPTNFLGRDVHGGTLGVVGLGNIGKAVVERAAGFDMRILYTGPRRQPQTKREFARKNIDISYVPLEETLQKSDVLTLHVPLNADTEHLISDSEFEIMRSNTILINASRGKVVDLTALDRALERDSIGAAALDVTEPEPLPGSHPVLDHQPEKLIITPHIGTSSYSTRRKMARMTAENVLYGLRGEPLQHDVFEDVTHL